MTRDHPPVVSREAWLEARLALLEEEKALTRQKDALARNRRALPWVRIDTPYRFEGPDGPVTLADLFGDQGQLLVYHFMFGPDWSEGCPICSFWADTFDGIDLHLAHRDVRFVVVSAAPVATLEAYRARMGWRFAWVSSGGTTFNRDFGVGFGPEDRAPGVKNYNFGTQRFGASEAPGASAFVRQGEEVFHTYSCYGRGLDILNGAYQWLDIAPRGRDEDGLPFSMAWLRRRDQYGV